MVGNSCKTFFRKVLEGEMLKANQAFLSELREKDQLSGSLPNLGPDARLFVTFARFNRGYLTAATENELNDRDLNVLRRVTVAFERAFQRFEDLQHAEAAAREAQIEAALERVRGRALAMRTTDELLSIAELVTDQLVLLGLNMGSAFVSTVDEERDVYGLYTCCSQRHPLKDLRGKSGAWNYSFAAISDNSTELDFFSKWNQGEPFRRMHIPADEFDAWYDTFEDANTELGVTKERLRPVYPNGLFTVESLIGSGSIGLLGHEDYSDEDVEILVRFANEFRGAYTRFKDIQKAEEQAREAQIEAALERVRARATAMQHSTELSDIVGKIFEELTQLDFVLTRCIIWIFDEENNVSWWMANPEAESGAESYDLGLNDFPVYLEHLKAWQEKKPSLLYTLSGEAKVAFDDHIFVHTGLSKLPKVAQDGMREPDAVFLSNTIDEFGLLMVASLEPLSEANFDIVQRFGRVFQQAYTRFSDVQIAEAQAREARIEAALERVRARSMAMQKSDELAEVSLLLDQEVRGLGTETWGCAFNIYGPHDSTEWFGSEAGIDNPYKTPREKFFLRFYEKGQAGETFYVEEFGGDKCRQHYDYMKTLPGLGDMLKGAEVSGHPLPSYQVDHVAFFKYGYLLFITLEPALEAHDIFKRFAAVFEQTYTRFLDLQQAEAQAREAQIEAALERVRAQAMSMQTSEDIGQTALFLFNEILELCSSVLRVGLWIMSGPDEMEGWLAGSDDKGNVGLVKSTVIKRGDRPEVDLMMDSWVSGKSCSFLETDSFLQWAREIVYKNEDQNIVRVEKTTEQHLTTFIHKNGFLNVASGAGLTPEVGEGAIIQRFAGVFDLAYQRYHDLAQAESDYEALLAEKALTEETLTVLQATQAQLVEQEKLASLGALTAGIAHEIKNPLNFVNNFAEVSSELTQEIIEALEAGDTDEAKSIASELTSNSEQITKHGKRADSIVRSMMQHAHGGKSELESIELNTYLEEYVNLAWHGMRARDDGFSAEIKRDFDPAVGKIRAMPQELGRVILNLLNNAFDAIREIDHATVTVATRQLERNHIELTVSDNGPGIPEDIREKIFEPFFTTKATGEGTGLGLSLSYDIITKAHGGTMTVIESDERTRHAASWTDTDGRRDG